MTFPVTQTTLIVLTVLLCPVAATAQQPEGSDPLSRGNWTLELSGSGVQHIRFSEDTFWTGSVMGGYYLFDGFSINGELMGAFVDQPHEGEDAGLGGAGVVLRWHALRFDHDAFTLFVDGGGDLTYADPQVPEFGTHFNFVGKVGVGGSVRLSDDVFLLGGVRYFHLSNGNLHGRDQNPSYDGVQYWAGVMFRF